jgi:hypothetical protein
VRKVSKMFVYDIIVVFTTTSLAFGLGRSIFEGKKSGPQESHSVVGVRIKRVSYLLGKLVQIFTKKDIQSTTVMRISTSF